jgi:ABC-2 type transport system permease protein
MRLYLEIARRSFQRHLAYRSAALAGLFTNAVFGILIASVYLGLYDSRAAAGSVKGFDGAEIVTFVWIGQAMLAVVSMYGWWEIATTIRTGDVVTDLMKPFDFFSFWLARDLGRAGCQVLLRFAPTMLFGALLYDLALPESPVRMAAFAMSVLLAVVVSFGVRFLANICGFWLIEIRGVAYLTYFAMNFFGGLLVPIAFFPGWLRVVAEALPFQATFMLPVEVFLGQTRIWQALALQGFWAVVLGVLAQFVLARAVQKLEVQGG